MPIVAAADAKPLWTLKARVRNAGYTLKELAFITSYSVFYLSKVMNGSIKSSACERAIRKATTSVRAA